MEEVLKIIADFRKSHQESNQPFNIFTMLLQKHSEAYLHSSFLSWLLDPKAPHKLGVLPMHLFLKKIGSHHYSVDKETTHITPNAINKTEEGDIDILIEDAKQDFAIIIENKIYAVDSNTDKIYGQLQKYFWQVRESILRRNGGDNKENRKIFHPYKEENIEVFYLTPDGHEPSHDSTSMADDLRMEISDEVGGRQVKLISYMNHVLPWLKELLNKEEVIRNTYVHEIIAQYMDIVISISCDIERNKTLFKLVSNFNLEQLKQLKAIIQKYELEKDLTKRYERILKEERDNAETIDFILNNIKHVYWHSLDDFFQKLATKLEKFLIPRPGRALSEVLTDIVHKENRPKDLFLEIRGGWRLQFDEHMGANELPKGFFLCQYNENGWVNLVESKYINKPSEYDFRDFTKGDTFDLLNEDKRNTIAKQYADFVKQELNNLNPK